MGRPRTAPTSDVTGTERSVTSRPSTCNSGMQVPGRSLSLTSLRDQLLHRGGPSVPKLRPARLSLLLAGVGAAVVLAPGVAWATPSPPAPGADPLGTVQQQVQDTAGGLLSGSQGGAGAGANSAPKLSNEQTATDTGTAGSSPAAPTLPPQLQDLLDKLS